MTLQDHSCERGSSVRDAAARPNWGDVRWNSKGRVIWVREISVTTRTLRDHRLTWILRDVVKALRFSEEAVK